MQLGREHAGAQHREHGEVHPRQKNDDRPDGPIRLVVVAEVLYVDPKDEGHRDPRERRDEGAGERFAGAQSEIGQPVMYCTIPSPSNSTTVAIRPTRAEPITNAQQISVRFHHGRLSSMAKA